MAWTSPTTRSTGDLITASIWNTDLVDNLKVTAAGIVTTAGDIVYATAANALARLGIGTANQILRTNAGATAPEWATQNQINIFTGSYTGDGTTSKAITGVGFQPTYVRIWNQATADASNVCVMETTDTIIDDHANGMAIQFAIGGVNFVGKIDAIISLDADGFTVDDAGADDHPNKNTVVYNYICLG